MDNCIFCRIVNGELPSTKIYEDDEIVAFNDIQPIAPVHFMLVPRKHIPSLAEASAEYAGAFRQAGEAAGLDRRLSHGHQHGPHRPAGRDASSHTHHRGSEPTGSDD